MEVNNMLDAASIDTEEGISIESQTPLALDSGAQTTIENGSGGFTENGQLHVETDDDFTAAVLAVKGIPDPTKIKFEDESGAVIERDWNDLTRDEQVAVLTQSGDPETDLQEDEIQLINAIREHGISPEDYVNYLQQFGAEEALKKFGNSERMYKIDELGDDELYLLDFMRKVGQDNVSDEELEAALNSAKSNETLYKKTVNALRDEYKALEDESILLKQQQEVFEAEQQWQDFSDNILTEILGLNSIGDLAIELSNDDMNELANFILTRDDNGVSEFGSMMNNPKALTTMAFWMLKGPAMLNELQDLIQKAYKRGYDLAKGSNQLQSKLVIKPRTATTANGGDAMSAFGSDESYLYS